jgi:hypothetical protein
LNSKTLPATPPQSYLIRLAARIVSVILHPLFITSYIAAFLIFFHPAVFAGVDHRTKMFRMLSILLFTAFFPGFTVFIAWRLKLIKSILLSTAKERIIPYAAVMFFYWWTWYVFRNLPETPLPAVRLLMGSFLAICAAWFCNIFFKISMHAVAAGGFLMYFLLFELGDPYGSGLYLSVAVLLAGMVCTSRLIVSDHVPADIYAGFFAGMASMWIGWHMS